MKFACDSCQAQYMISDEKVGPNGVIVRCKKCQHKILVKRPEPPPAQEEERAEATVVMNNPIAAMTAEMNAADAAKAAEAAAASFNEPSESPEPQSALTAPEMPAVATPAAEASANPFGLSDGGMDEDIGKAFDSVLSGPASSLDSTNPGLRTGQTDLSSAFPFDTGGGYGREEGDTDRQSTRVVNLAEMASLIKNEAPSPVAPEKNSLAAAPEKRDDPAPASSTAAEWFVAIDDQQVGPLNLDAVRKRWDAGELSADSLAWKSGMSDWRALSTIDELSHYLVPLKKKPEPEKVESPAGATATGAQSPATSTLPPQQDVAATDWKPSAASALEALVKDELAAMAKPAPKAPEPAAQAASRGLFDELPEAPEPVRAPMPDLAPLPDERTQTEPLGALPAAEPAKPVEAPEPPAASALPVRPAPRAAPAERRPATYAPPAPAQPPAKSRTGLWVGMGIGGGVALSTIAIMAFMLFAREPTVVVAPPPSEPLAVAPARTAEPAAPPAQPPAPATAEPAAPAAPAAAAEAPKTTEAPAATAAAAPAQPPAAAATAEPAAPKAVEKPAEPAQAEPPKVAEKPKAKEPERRETRDTRVASRERQREREREAETITAPPPRVKEPDPEPVAKVNRNKVDDDFDKIFGTGGGDATPEPAAQPKAAQKPKTVYVPPPAGGSLPDKLGQSDIMGVVVGQKPIIKQCIDEQKAKDPDASGTLVMRWTIRPDGTTTGIQTRTAEFQKTPMSACMAAAIKTWKFPPYSGAQMPPIDFPFKF